MRALPIVAASILASAAVAFFVATLVNPEPAGPVTPPGAMQEDLLAIRQAQSELQRNLSALDNRLEALASASSRVAIPEISDAQLERVVASVLDARGDPVEAAGNGEAELDLRAIHASLIGSNPDDSSEVWARVKEAGKLDDLVALFEERARANPDLPQAQMDLGNAYLQKLMAMTPGPQSGVVATQAEDAFTRVLEIDPNHWGARFTRAMSFTFWPDFVSKKQQAIDEFELLIGQQEQLPSQPHYAQTYLFLGNLYEQRGELQKAADIWSKGLRFFPDDSDLRAKVK